MSKARCPIKLDVLLTRHLTRCGYQPSDFDVTDVASVDVLGVRIDSRGRAAEQIEQLLRAKHVVVGEWNGKLVFRRLAGLTATAVPSRDVGVRMLPEGEYPEGWSEQDGTLQLTRQPARELAFEVAVGYLDVDGDYQPGVQRAMRYTREDQQDSITIGTTMTMEADEAARFAEAELYKLWVQSLSARVTLRRRWLRLAPTDVISLPTPSGAIPLRVIQMQIHPLGPVQVVAVQHDAAVISQVKTGSPFVPGPALVFVTQTKFFAFVTNALRDEDADAIGFYMTANGTTPGIWSGVAVHMSRDNGASYQVLALLANGAPFGKAETVLPAGWTTGVWDMTATVEVTMDNGTIESTSDAEVLNGANVAMLGEEVIQFVTVTSLGGSRYRLSRLLRGRRGTDAYWNGHTVGERFIVLDPLWVERVNLTDDLYDRTILLKAVPDGGSLASTPAVPLHITGRERWPYSPAHLKAVQQPNGDWSLSWIRRTRKGGELQDGVDVPLSESAELYEVDLLSATGATLRTLTVMTQGATWTAAQQATDAGGPQATVRFCVYQRGRYGRGYGSCLTVTTAPAQRLTATAMGATGTVVDAALPQGGRLIAVSVAGTAGITGASLLVTSPPGTLGASAAAATLGMPAATLRGGPTSLILTAVTGSAAVSAANVLPGNVMLTATALAAPGTLATAGLAVADILTATAVGAQTGMGTAALVAGTLGTLDFQDGAGTALGILLVRL